MGTMTSVFLSNRHVQAAVGTPGAQRVQIQKLCDLMLPEGCLINGVITNEGLLASELQEFWMKNGLPCKEVGLVIDSTQFFSKTVNVPSMPPKKMLEIAQKELSSMENRQEPLVDYMLLRHDASSKTDTILASSVERGFVDGYVSLFQKIGVELCNLDTALASELKLVEFLPSFRDKTCILVVFDGDNLHATLVESGQYKYSSRTRLFSEHGSADFGTEVTRTLSSTMQFQLSDKSGYAITDVYFAGCSDEDFAACEEGCRMLSLSAGFIADPTSKIVLPARVRRLGDCLFTAGNLIRR